MARSGTLHFPTSSIFDTRFVSDNVYSGDAVAPEQRRELHKFVLGAANVGLAHAVDELDAEIRQIGALLREGEGRLGAIAGKAYTIEEFLKLTPPADIAQLVANQRDRLALAEQSAAVISTPAYSSVDVPQLDTSGVLSVLAVSLEPLSSDAERRVKEHAAHHLDEEGIDWLERGMVYLGDGPDCPFCGQAAQGSSLISDYRQFFSQEYDAHLRAVEAIEVSLATEWSTEHAEQAIAAIRSNRAIAPFWSQHAVPAPAEVGLATIEHDWKSARAALSAMIARKRLDILAAVVPAAHESAALASFASALDSVTAYNASVATANASIEAKKSAAGVVTVSNEQASLVRLVAAVARGTASVSADCDKVVALRRAKTEKEASKTKARAALDASSTELFVKFEGAINKHLERSGCAYRITGTKTAYQGGKPRTEYQLQLNGKAVDLARPKTNPLAPHFGNTLSDGDRSTLAFALFLARLDLDPRLSEKIVVIDDPMTSLDAHRRAYTRERVARLAKSAKQVILLSHDALFAREVWDSVAPPKTSLILRADGDSTVIAEWDIVSATHTEYFLRCEMLIDCVNGQQSQSRLATVGVLRPVLEANLRMRFPRLFPSGEWLGGFIRLIREADGSSPLFRMQSLLEEIEDINNYSKRYHHDDGPVAGAGEPNLAELQSYCRRTLTLISGAPTI